MKSVLLALIACLLALPLLGQASAACTGSTEDLLQCHSAEVKEFLKVWVRAWGNGDADTYISLYTKSRSPKDGVSRDTWESQRRARVTPDKQIEISLKLESMGLEDSGIFDVVFLQQYQSPTYRDEVRKRLFLLREGENLKIWKEENLP